MRTSVAIIGLFALLAPLSAHATAQMGDILVYKGERVSIYTNPLEMYFSDKNPRPNDLFPSVCTASWRGYQASWKIEDGYLYLERLVEGTCGPDAKEIPLEKVFPDQKGPVKATWFTGSLRIPRGKQLKYVHMGYESVYEKELFITIEAGKVVKEETIDNSPKKKPAPDKKDAPVKEKKK